MHFVVKRIRRSDEEPFAILDPSNKKTHQNINTNQTLQILADYSDAVVQSKADNMMEIYEEAKKIKKENTHGKK